MKKADYTSSYLNRLFSMNDNPSCRLIFGSLGFLTFIVLVILVCIMKHQNTSDNLTLVYHLGYISAGLIGLSAIDFSNLKFKESEKKDGR
jgi:hypothetical protein